LSTFVESRLYIDDIDTVDGSEIWRSPVKVGSFSHYLYTGFFFPGGAGFLPSTVSFYVQPVL